MKKLICLMLCLMMIIPATVSLADTQISSVTVSLVNPGAGASASAPSVNVPSSAKYTYASGKSRWHDGETSQLLTSSSKFQAGKLYMAEIYLNAASGYYFGSGTTVTCTTPCREVSIQNEGNHCMVYVYVFVTEAGISLISNASVSVSLPEAETGASGKPSVKIPSGAHYRYVSEKSGWIDEEAMKHDEFPTDMMPSSAKLEAGKRYMALIHLQADDGYRFNYDLTGNNVPNAKGTYHRSYYTFCRVYVEFIVPNNRISLKPVKISQVKAVSAKKIKVSWKKLTGEQKKKIKKIQIQVSTDKQFTKIVKKKIISSSKTSWTISGLKKNTKYYVRIRAYTKSGNVINVSKWVVKSKKTKKK